MTVLGICASPRIGGNSDLLLDACLKGAEYNGAIIRKIYLGGLNISPCAEEEYFNADEKGYSPIKDDMEKIFREVEKADIIIVASPIFFGSISAQLKIMIDRFQSVWTAKNIMKKDVFNKPKRAGFICVSAAGRDDFFENADFIVRHFFATVAAKCDDRLFVPGFESKGSVGGAEDVLEKARKLGKKLAGYYQNLREDQ